MAGFLQVTVLVDKTTQTVFCLARQLNTYSVKDVDN